jgi:hypothetical protein
LRSERDGYDGGAAHLYPDRYERVLRPLEGAGFTGDSITG